MKEKGMAIFKNGLIWFGAAVSIAEIMTGTYFAPLGFEKGFFAIVLGHIIGCVMLYLAGLIGAKTQKSAMESVSLSFGNKGALFFSIINVIQLVGWTAIMIYDGSMEANRIWSIGAPIWCIVIGALISLWVAFDSKNFSKVNVVSISMLFILTIILSYIIFGKGTLQNSTTEGITFGAAVELSVAMPLSWLPLISDYTKEAAKPVKEAAVSAITYGLVSCWMYIIGMGAAIYTAESDVAQIMMKSGLGLAGLFIIVFSTVTTTFLDAYSAGVSSEVICKKVTGKCVAIVVAAIGAVSAIFFPISNITEFLYFIGSIFAPMIAIQIADFYILKTDTACQKLNVKNSIIWFIGFVIYRLLMKVDVIVGSTLLDVMIIIIICCVVGSIEKKMRVKMK